MKNKALQMISEAILKQRKVINILIPTALFIVSFVFRLVSFQQTSYANGWDSYFYLIQIKSLLEQGAMHSKDWSLIYPFMILVQFLVKDYILTYKISAALLAAFFSLLIYLLSLKWSNERSIAGILGCLTLYSPHLTYFSGQYPKNMLGINLFLLFLMYIEEKRISIPFALVILNFFGHRLTSILAVLFGALFLSMKKQPKIVIAILAVLLIFIVIGVFLPGILSYADIERFQDVITRKIHFTPYTFIVSFGTNLLSPYWISEIIVVSIIFLVSLALLIKRVFQDKIPSLFASLAIILFLLIFPFLKWSIDGIGFRFFMVFVLIAPLVLVQFTSAFRNKTAVSTIGIVLICLSFFSYKSYNPKKHDPPYLLYDRISKKALTHVDKTQVDLIIAHKSLAEYFTFTTGIDAMPWVPEYNIAEDKLWRIGTNVSDTQLRYYLSKPDLEEVYRLSLNYFLLKEITWKKLNTKIKKDHDTELIRLLDSWKNPSKIRPLYLLKNK